MGGFNKMKRVLCLSRLPGLCNIQGDTGVSHQRQKSSVFVLQGCVLLGFDRGGPCSHSETLVSGSKFLCRLILPGAGLAKGCHAPLGPRLLE